MNLWPQFCLLPLAAILAAVPAFASLEQRLPELSAAASAGSSGAASVPAPVVSRAADPAVDFSRYQTILDRLPFGALPPNFDPSAPAAAGGGSAKDRAEAENQLAAAVRLCMLNVTPAGLIAVGFTDSSVNPPVNYYLMVGQSQNGWTVADADPATQSATLEKDGISLVLALGATPAAGGKAGATSPGLRHSGLLGRSFAAPVAAAADNNGAAGSFAGALRARRVAQQQEDAERKAREQAEEQKRQEQMDALKQIRDELLRERQTRNESAAAEPAAADASSAADDAEATARAEAARVEAARAEAERVAAAEAAARADAAAQAAADAAAAQAEAPAESSATTKKTDEIPIMGWPATHKLKNSN